MARIENIPLEKLADFHSEVERGCMYKVKALEENKAGYEGIIEGPSIRITENGVPYDVVPVDSLKRTVFDIARDEVGDLVDVGFRGNDLGNIRVVWKRSIQIYYSKELAGKFDFIKINPLK